MSTTLVLGGARSGKSLHAEQLLHPREDVTYVATGPLADGTDPEWSARVGLHRARRPLRWSTVETDDLVRVIGGATGPVLIDCLGSWLAGVIDRLDGWDDHAGTSRLLQPLFAELEQAWTSARADLVAVTNEVGLGVVPATASGRLFRDELGRLNSILSAASDQVSLVLAGRVLDLSACPVVGVPPGQPPPRSR